MKYLSLFFLFQIFNGCRECKELCSKLIFTKEIMKLFSFRIQAEWLKKLFIFKIIFFNSFWNILLTKFLLKLPTDPSCSVFEFYKDRLQSLTKK